MKEISWSQQCSSWVDEKLLLSMLNAQLDQFIKDYQTANPKTAARAYVRGNWPTNI